MRDDGNMRCCVLAATPSKRELQKFNEELLRSAYSVCRRVIDDLFRAEFRCIAKLDYARQHAGQHRIGLRAPYIVIHESEGVGRYFIVCAGRHIGPGEMTGTVEFHE